MMTNDLEIAALTQRLLDEYAKEQGGYEQMTVTDIAKAAALATVVAIKRVEAGRRSAAVN